MAAPDAKEVRTLVEEVLRRLQGQGVSLAEESRRGPEPSTGARPGVWSDVSTAVAKAWEAQRELARLSLETRAELIAAMRRAVRENASELARRAVEETGLGRVEDKVLKNLLVGEKTPGVEWLAPWAVSGDHGLTLEEAAPWGVIAAITPSTNPTETIICNGIGMIAAGNAVVFGPHPGAQDVSAFAVGLLNNAVAGAGGPSHLLCSYERPTIERAQELMAHEDVSLLVVTGGAGVVQVAMGIGKRVLAAGPGNPPAVVDATADLGRAAKNIVAGASLDNNIVCSDEKEAIVVSSVADKFKQHLEGAGAFELHGHQIQRMAELVLERAVPGPSASRIRTEWVGKDAERFLDAIGVHPRKPVRLLFADVDANHPFVWTELMMPILPVVRVRDVHAAMDLAVAAEGGRRHTATIHSRNIESLSRLARLINTSIFVKNGPSFAGLGMNGEGYTSFTIAGPTGEGLTTARDFCRVRRCTLVDSFRIV